MLVPHTNNPLYTIPTAKGKKCVLRLPCIFNPPPQKMTAHEINEHIPYYAVDYCCELMRSKYLRNHLSLQKSGPLFEPPVLIVSKSKTFAILQ